MTDVTPFDFKGNRVRTVMIDGDPWFVAVDVCSVLEIKNSRDAVSSLDEEEVQVVPVGTTDGSERELPTNVIDESGLYSLVLRSRKEEARDFKRWITREVLPQIRKTGSYGQPQSQLDILAGAIRALQEQEAAVAALTAGQAEIVQRQVELEARQDLLQENHERVSSVGWANLRKARSDVWFLAKLGRKAAKIAKRDDIEPSKVHSQIFGEVHSWPLHIWDEAYEAMGGA